MKLIIIIGNFEREMLYRENEIILKINHGSDIDYLLNSKEEREKDLLDLKEYNELYTGEEFAEEDIISNNKIINDIESLPDHIDSNYFNKIEITTEIEIDVDEYKAYLESITKIISFDTRDLSSESLLKMEKIKFHIEPLLKSSENDINFVPLYQYLESIHIIKDMKEYIEHYKLSPIEQLMFLYDLLKKRVYKNNDTKHPSSCRDLCNVLNGDDIVCRGYSNIFVAVAKALGIPAHNKIYVPKNPENNGHSVAVAMVNDDKYNIHSPLEFDPTWDAKKENDYNNYINNYRCFALPENISEKYKSKLDLEPASNSTYNLKKFLKRMKQITKDIDYPKYIETDVKLFTTELQHLYDDFHDETIKDYLEQTKIVFPASVSKTLELFDEVIEYLNKKFERILSFEEFAQILYTVRRVEHSIDPSLYAYDANTVMKAAGLIYDKSFINLLKILGVNENEIINKQDYMKNINARGNKIPYDIKRMELIHVLNKAVEQKKGLTK